MQHLTPEQKQYVLRRYQEGASLRGIGREIRRPDITVRRTLIALGIEFGPPKTNNKRSTPETEGLALRLYGEGRTWQEINDQAGITSATLAKILTRNGRPFSRRSDADADADLIAALYESGHSTRAIGKMLGHGKTTVNSLVARQGGELRQMPGCEYPDFFEVIDTPEKAYWLGFISADGCIVTTVRYPEGSHLAIHLSIRDRGHLLKFKETIGATAAVNTGAHRARGKASGYATLAIGSRRLTKSLIALGVTPRKSTNVQPWAGPADLMPHYWRGLFDGDGSIAKKTGTLWTAFLCGSEPCVRGFTAWAHELTGTNATPYFRTGCWYVSISGRYQVPKLVRAMYADAPVSLDRKQERADAILAADGPRKKPGPASRFATPEEKAAHVRKQKAEIRRRYVARKREREATESA